MAQIIKVLLFGMLFLLAYGQQPATRPIQQLPEGRILDLVSLSKLLQTAARLAYPITDRLNHVVGNLRETENYPFLINHGSNTGYAGRRPNINRNLARSRPRPDIQNLRRVHQDRRHKSHQSMYDYDYEYEYDYDNDYGDYIEPRDTLEIGDDLGVLLELDPNSPNPHAVIIPDAHNVPIHKSLPAAMKPVKRPNDGGVPFVGGTGTKVLKYPPGNSAPISKVGHNVLPVTNEPQPKIIYVVVSPADINPAMNNDNTVHLVNSQGLAPIEDRTTDE